MTTRKNDRSSETDFARFATRRLNIIGQRTSCENGRIVTRFMVDASRELGRGEWYWLEPGIPPEAK